MIYSELCMVMYCLVIYSEFIDGDEVKDDEVGVYGVDDVYQIELVLDCLLVFFKLEVDYFYYY